MSIEFDPAKARSNLCKHGVSFGDGEQVLRDPGAVIASPGRTPITMTLDDAVIEHFRARAEAEGTGYQDLINDILRAAVAAEAQRSGDDAPLTVGTLRRVLREELHTP